MASRTLRIVVYLGIFLAVAVLAVLATQSQASSGQSAVKSIAMIQSGMYQGGPISPYSSWLDPNTLPNPPLPDGYSPIQMPEAPEYPCAGFGGCWKDPEPAPGEQDPSPPQCSGIACLWPDPEPDPGDGAPDPGEYCAGFTCEWPEPAPGSGGGNGPPPILCDGMGGPCGWEEAPPATGCKPPWPPLCMGLDCGGSANPSPGPIPPAPEEPIPSDPWMMSGPASPIASENPVDLIYGNKFETAVDLIVPVPGPDFMLTRSYNSQPGSGGANLIGNNWALNTFMFIERTNHASESSDLFVSTPTGGRRKFVWDSGSSKWLPTGPTTQYITKSPAYVEIDGDRWPVHWLVEPGTFKVAFIRDNAAGETGSPWVTVDDQSRGLVLQIFDIYEDNKRTYEYQTLGSSPNHSIRLKSIYLNGTDNDDSLARIDFSWCDEDDDNGGKLEKVTVYRGDLTSLPESVQTVEYTYFESGSYNAAVGTPGDLIQVVKRVAVDRAESGEEFHRTVTQYRYHSTGGNETSTDTDGDGFIEWGNNSQLKMVILPEQIEFAAQQEGDNDNALIDVVDHADAMLAMTDATAAWTGASVQIADLASKVIEEYEPFDPTPEDNCESGRVKVQHLQTSCGCGGAAKGLRIEYDYFAFEEPAAGDFSRRTRIKQEINTGSTPDPYRTFYHDFKLAVKNDQELHFLGHRAMTDDTNTPAKYWVTSAEYDLTGGSPTLHLTKMIHPSAVETAYVPNDSCDPCILIDSGCEPSISFHDDAGVVYEYEYNSDHRLTKTTIKEGTDGSASAITEVVYQSSGQTWLPETVYVARIAGVSDPSTTNGTAPNDIQVIEYDYGFFSGTNAVEWVGVTFEAELSGENGPGGTYSTYTVFNSQGQPYWTRRADNTLIYRTFDSNCGGYTSVTINPNETFPSTDTAISGAGGFGRYGADPGEIQDSVSTAVTYDNLGRIRTLTSESGVVTRFVREVRLDHDSNGTTADHRPYLLYYALVALPHEVTSAPTFTGPAMVTWFNAGNRSFAAMEVELQDDEEDGYGDIFTGYDYNLDFSNPLSRGSLTHSYTGLVQQRREWHNLDGDGENGGLYDTLYTYDDLGRMYRITDPDGSITEYAYDFMNRVVAIKAGTTSTTPVTLTEYTYDNGGVGDGLVTKVKQFTDESYGPTREFNYEYDFRHRMIRAENPDDPEGVIIVYDNQDRPIKAALFSVLPGDNNIDNSTSLSNNQRGIYIEMDYSQRGLLYRSAIATDPNDATPDFLETHFMYDEVGRPIFAWGPNGPATKTNYDAIGRVANEYIVDIVNIASNRDFDDVYDDATKTVKVGTDIVLEQTDYEYIDDGTSPVLRYGNLELTTHWLRGYEAGSTTGALSAFAGGNADDTVATFSGFFYDDGSRLVTAADYGTNQTFFEYGGTPPTITQGSPPTSGAITSSVTYNERGLIDTTTDPNGIKSKAFYDDLGRTIVAVENWQSAGIDEGDISWDGPNNRWTIDPAVPSENPDEDRVTSVAYRITAKRIDQVAHKYLSDTETVQVTQYLFDEGEGSPSDDKATTNSQLREIIYPDGDAEFFAYNRLGELRYHEDQNGTTHEYQYDLLGRQTLDKVTAFGTDIDDAINAVTTTYDDFGRVDAVYSYNDYGGGGVATVNGVQFTYTDLWTLDRIYQEHDGAVTGGSKYAEYTYDTAAVASGNWHRLIDVEYPLDGHADFDYGSSTTDARISRLKSVGTVGGRILRYANYLGLATPVITELDETGVHVELDRVRHYDGVLTAGRYNSFDQFGRVTMQMWTDYEFADNPSYGTIGNKPQLLLQRYTHDDAGNILTKYNDLKNVGDHDFDITLDELDRVTEAERGNANELGGSASFTHIAGSQQWVFDILGNWNNVKTDLNANHSYGDTGEDKQRSHNTINELTGVDTAGDNLTLTYDDAGNLRTQQIYKTGGTTKYYEFTHDAWGRCTAVEHITDVSSSLTYRTIAEHEYNPLGWRVRSRFDKSKNFDDVLDQERTMYYNASWQLMEEKIDDDINALGGERQREYYYGGEYVDNVFLIRESNNLGNDGGGITYEDNWYFLWDAHFNVMVVIDDAAQVVERVDYSSYGTPRHHYRADLDGDGDVDSGDLSTISTLAAVGLGGTPIEDATYIAYADLDRDGDVDSTDYSIANGEGVKTALAEGILTAGGVDNIHGFSGYIYTPVTKLYHLRMRWYSTDLGRFTTRDPLGYVDGMNLYQYVEGMPLRGMDPYGLRANTTTLQRKIMKARGWKTWPVDKNGNPKVIHHIKYVEFGGTDDLDNLEVMTEEEHIRLHRERGDYERWGKKGAAAKAAKRRVALGGGILGLIGAIGLAQEANAMSPDLLTLFGQLNRTSDYALANMIATEIALKVAEFYASAGMDIKFVLMEEWGRMQRERVVGRRPIEEGSRRPAGKGKGKAPKQNEPSPAPREFDPCSPNW